MRRLKLFVILMICAVVFMKGGFAMADDKTKLEAIRAKLASINLSDGVSKEEAVIIAQNHLIDEGVSLKDVDLFRPRVQQSGLFDQESLTKKYMEEKFDRGGEIFDWLMKNGYFLENDGVEGHPKELTDDKKKAIKEAFPKKEYYRISASLELVYDCWCVTFNASLSVKWNSGLNWFDVHVEKKTGKVRSSGWGPS